MPEYAGGALYDGGTPRPGVEGRSIATGVAPASKVKDKLFAMQWPQKERFKINDADSSESRVVL